MQPSIAICGLTGAVRHFVPISLFVHLPFRHKPLFVSMEMRAEEIRSAERTGEIQDSEEADGIRAPCDRVMRGKRDAPSDWFVPRLFRIEATIAW
ncbi:MAG: hypothetical protein EPO23_09065 [Xanthobacteraceae bacterium]|nr:MAG: hypothetical protein EPO23_09065 [Xanthobacteraceae bacterium]